MAWCIYSTPAERREINRFFSRGKIGGNLFFQILLLSRETFITRRLGSKSKLSLSL